MLVSLPEELVLQEPPPAPLLQEAGVQSLHFHTIIFINSSVKYFQLLKHPENCKTMKNRGKLILFEK